MSTTMDEPSTSSREKHHLETADASSLFILKGELYRKINEQRQKTTVGVEKIPKKSVLRVTKEEDKKLTEERQRRQERIRELEKSVQQDEEQRKRVQRILEEKSEIYARLSRGEAVLNGDNEPVEFLVDFDAKKREEEKRQQRVYGVSHVPLPVREEKRQEQIKELLDLSKKTETSRAKRKVLLEQREKMKWERLNRIRKRKGLEELPPPGAVEEIDETKYLDIPLPEGPPTAPEEEPKPKQFAPVREWDRGKALYDRWIKKQREERDEEFAPPASYFRQ
ncbi:unnamed protein product [Gongylonema pulchrum]|uniref:Coiled-coil domain-containing protein 174 n=1 Tax=Gongylonema pulchrum TaxID=637853 RepID=A0A183DYV6_9BILA|nr:unnamed protein product [Gongylonema pulchrum]